MSHPPNSGNPQRVLLPAGDRPLPRHIPGIPARRNNTRACDACKQHKKKCDGNKPFCGTCAVNQLECTYNTPDRRRLDARNHEVDQLRAGNDQAVACLQMLVGSPEHVSYAMLADLRARLNPTLSDPQAPTLQDVFSEQCALWLNEQSESGPPEYTRSLDIEGLYTPDNLPPQREVREGARFFFENTSSLFYVMTIEEVDALLDRVYHSSDPADTLGLCEVCSLASVGCQYLPDQQTRSKKQALYLTASVHLRDCLRTDRVRAIRILVCLACHDIVAHRNSARLSIVLFGLRLARAELGRTTFNLDLLGRIYRTLIFLDCWLATSLGFTPESGELERLFIDSSLEQVTRPCKNEADVQEIAGMVAVFKADVLLEAYRTGSDTSTIDKHMSRLEGWYSHLPREIHLTSLLSDEESPLPASLYRGLLFVHVFFLGAFILLHRKLLPSMTAMQLGSLTPDSSLDTLLAYSERPITAARQIARIFCLIDYEKNIFRRCWLCISEIYSSSTVILFAASLSLAVRDTDSIHEDLSIAGRMITMLSHASADDHVAKRLHSLLQPLHAEIGDLQNIATTSNRTPDGPGADPAELDFDYRCRVVVQKSINHLQNVFGDKTRLDIVSLEQSEIDIPTWWT